MKEKRREETSFSRLLSILGLVAVVLVAACAQDRPQPAARAAVTPAVALAKRETGSTKEAYSNVAVARVIPIRFVNIGASNLGLNSASPSAASLENAVNLANATFKDTGIQFTMRSYEYYYMPNVTAALADTMGMKSWTQLSSDFTQVFGSVAGLPGVRTGYQWLTYAAYAYAPLDAIHVWIAPSLQSQMNGVGGISDAPDKWRSITLSPSAPLAHELERQTC